MALKFALPEGVAPESVKVGLAPSQGSGLVQLDEDLNGVFKVTDKSEQKFVVQIGSETVQYDLSGLVCQEE